MSDFLSFDFKAEFKRAIGVAKLDKKAILGVAADSKITRVAVIFILLGALAGAMGSLVFPIQVGPVTYAPTLLQAIGNMIEALIWVLAGVYVVNFIADRVGGKGSFESFFRVIGYGYVVTLLTFFPILGTVASIWLLVILGRALVQVKKLTVQKTAVVLIITMAVFVLLGVLIGGINVANLYGGMYVAPGSMEAIF